MPSMVMLGLVSWILTGLATALAGRVLLPGRPRLTVPASLIAGVGGALLGGLLATVLGFGGLAGFDPRSLVTATLASILCLLILRGAWLSS